MAGIVADKEETVDDKAVDTCTDVDEQVVELELMELELVPVLVLGSVLEELLLVFVVLVWAIVLRVQSKVSV
jgi:hypothetical protein